MSSSLHTPHVEPGGLRVESLSWPSFGLVMAALLAIFFGLNPLWEDPDVLAVNQNVWWSYYPIPLLVGVALFAERKWSWPAFAIEVLRVTLVKFAVTYVVANTLWVFAGAPDAPAGAEPSASVVDPHGLFTPRAAPAATALDETTLGALEGLVTDASGAPLAGAFVWLDGLADDAVFAPPSEPLVLRHDGEAWSPRAAVAQSYRDVELVADGPALHTVHAVRRSTERRLFNVAFPPGTRRTVAFPRAYGVVTLGCRVPGHVHPHSALLVVDHPFAAVTGDDGRFAFDGVPAGAVTLRAATVTGEASAQLDVEVPSGASTRVDVAVRQDDSRVK